MERISRIGVSLEPKLLNKLDDFAKKRGYPSRSEAIRDMVRDRLDSEKLKDPKQESVGSITILYKHHQKGLSDKIMHFQHEHHDLIISTTHIHLDEDRCLEILVCKGKAGEIVNLSEKISAIKGVRHGDVSITSVRV